MYGFVKGRGLAVILGVGAIILAALDKQVWQWFLGASVFLFLVGVVANITSRHR